MLMPVAYFMVALLVIDWSTAQSFNCAVINDYSYPCICSTFYLNPQNSATSAYAIECSSKRMTDTSLTAILDNLNSLSDDARTYLSRLDLSNNRLTRIPENLNIFQNLKAVNFDYNGINTLFPGTFNFTAAQFREISLLGSKLKSIEPGAFQGTRAYY